MTHFRIWNHLQKFQKYFLKLIFKYWSENSKSFFSDQEPSVSRSSKMLKWHLVSPIPEAWAEKWACSPRKNSGWKKKSFSVGLHFSSGFYFFGATSNFFSWHNNGAPRLAYRTQITRLGVVMMETKWIVRIIDALGRKNLIKCLSNVAKLQGEG